MRHCDDYINDPNAPDVIRRFLDHARSPGHGHFRPDKRPTLFATYNGRNWKDVRKGDRVRVVMASRMGDVGITKHLDAEHGYSVRCAVDELSDFSES